MGFTTGFTGGVALTLSVAYLSVLAHQRNRQAQADSLRAQAHLLDTMSLAPGARLPPPPPSRAELAAAARANFVDRAKDRWNAEVAGAVQWAQEQDLEYVREGIEGALGRAWNRTFGSGDDGGSPANRGTAEAVQYAAGGTGGIVKQQVRAAVEESRAKGAEIADSAKGAAAAATESARDAIAGGVETGKGVVERVKAAVGMAEGKVVKGVKAAAEEVKPASDVEKALRQRYERDGDAVMQRSVTEVLGERYTPIAQKDNTVLRGV